MRRFLLPPVPEAGKLYSPLVVSVETIARRASSSAVTRAAYELCSSLSYDPYTAYITDFYRHGVDAAGDDWHFMDIVTVMIAIGQIGQPENYLEIGIRRGRSVCALISASPETDVYGFDMWVEGYGNYENPGPAFVREELARFGHRGSATFVDGDSHATVPQFLADHPGLTFDVITVDGDHSIDGAWDDLRNVVPRLRVGGVLVFDDTANPYCPGLADVWSALLAADRGLRGYSYGELGAGISFAVRAEPAPIGGIQRRPLRLLASRLATLLR